MSDINPFKEGLEDDGVVNGISQHSVSELSSPTQSSQFGYPVNSDSGHSHRCDECGQWFAGMGQLVKHANRQHGGAGIRSKPYSCKQCNKSFANASYLSQHNRIHQGVRPYKCEECTKTFTQLSHLQQHKRTHTGEKPYKCKYSGCTKAFSQLSNLQSHTRSHMTDKPFHCNSCYKCFSQQAELDQHRLEHGRQRLLRTHICKFCGKGYVQVAYLEKHIAKHENEDRSNGYGSRSTQKSPHAFSNGHPHQQHRPDSSLSSTPTTISSVMPTLIDANGTSHSSSALRQNGMPPTAEQMPQQAMTNSQLYSNTLPSTSAQMNFYNANGNHVAQEIDRLPRQQTAVEFFGVNGGTNGLSPTSVSAIHAQQRAAPSVSQTASTSALPTSPALPALAIPPIAIQPVLNMLPVISTAVINDHPNLHSRNDFVWQPSQNVTVVSSDPTGQTGHDWTLYDGPSL